MMTTSETRSAAAGPAASSRSDDIRTILQNKIQTGAKSALALIERIHTDVPRDQLAPAAAVKWQPTEGPGRSALSVNVDGTLLQPTEHALSQIAERAKIPALYLRGLTMPEVNGPTLAGWRPELAAHILREHYAHATGRMLVRSVRGELRGWLTDKYRRRNEARLVDTLAIEAANLGAIPIDGTATETQVSLKCILADLVQPLPGEWLAMGIDWRHSNFGNGANSVRAFVLRVRCLNGMTGEDYMREVHIGGRIAEDFEFSQRTYELNTETNVSAMRDIVRKTLGPAARESLIARIQDAGNRAMNATQLHNAIRVLPKSQHKPIVDAFESLDVVNLPPGETAWRASNAVSWIARHVDDPELRLEMERKAGELAGSK